jgi:hypothetical protein
MLLRLSSVWVSLNNLSLVLKTFYHGTAIKNALITKGSYVTPLFSRAAKYARYPGNGEGNGLGYVYRFDADESDVEWDERSDVDQGKLRCNIRAAFFAVSDVPINLTGRESPVRIRPDDSFYWNAPSDKREIVWVAVAD